MISFCHFPSDINAMHRSSIRSSMHHRRLPSVESSTSAGSSAEKVHPLHHTVQFEQASPSAPAPEAVLSPPPPPGPFDNKGRDFWLVFLALCVSSFLAAIDLTGVSTVLVTSKPLPSCLA